MPPSSLSATLVGLELHNVLTSAQQISDPASSDNKSRAVGGTDVLERVIKLRGGGQLEVIYTRRILPSLGPSQVPLHH